MIKMLTFKKKYVVMKIASKVCHFKFILSNHNKIMRIQNFYLTCMRISYSKMF